MRVQYLVRFRTLRKSSWRPGSSQTPPSVTMLASQRISCIFFRSYAQHRIAMIHAKKATVGSKMSASAFYDVCSQAVRYLGFFILIILKAV